MHIINFHIHQRGCRLGGSERERSGVRIPGRVKSKTKNLAPAASLFSVLHLCLEQGWFAQCQFKVTGWYFGVLALKPWLESGPVTADLTTTVIHSYKRR